MIRTLINSKAVTWMFLHTLICLVLAAFLPSWVVCVYSAVVGFIWMEIYADHHRLLFVSTGAIIAGAVTLGMNIWHQMPTTYTIGWTCGSIAAFGFGIMLSWVLDTSLADEPDDLPGDQAAAR